MTKLQIIERNVMFPCPYCSAEITHDHSGVDHMDRCERAIFVVVRG